MIADYRFSQPFVNYCPCQFATESQLNLPLHAAGARRPTAAQSLATPKRQPATTLRGKAISEPGPVRR